MSISLKKVHCAYYIRYYDIQCIVYSASYFAQWAMHIFSIFGVYV
jgi:hypothetical protein